MQLNGTCIGSTSRMLETKVAEHAGRSCQTDVRIAHSPHLAVREHAEGCGVRLANPRHLAVSEHAEGCVVRLAHPPHLAVSEHAGECGVRLAHPPHLAVSEHGVGRGVSVVKDKFKFLDSTPSLGDLRIF